jgi:ribosome-associated protein
MPALQDSINAIRVAAQAADRVKASDIVAFDVADLLGITDIMMIAGASNERQVLAVAEEIEKDLSLSCDHRKALSREGLTEGQWVLLDYGDFVIHVMHQESRDFYRLERLWRDCEPIDLQLVHPETSQHGIEPGGDSDDSVDSDMEAAGVEAAGVEAAGIND